MHGSAGDWLVESAVAERRTVAAEEFPRLYEWVTVDTFRAIGEVSGRQAGHAELVVTLEGPAMADRGDWVVTDDRGNSWPVPDPVFRMTYEEIA